MINFAKKSAKGCAACSGQKPDCHASPAVLQINNPSECVIFHKTTIPASMGNETTIPPANGAYKNMLVYYEGSGAVYLYSSDGVPTLISYTDYVRLINKPSINGVVLIGNKTLEELGIASANDLATETTNRESADQNLQSQITQNATNITSLSTAKADKSELPTKTSDLVNDSGFITEATIPTKTSDLINDSNFISDANYVHTDNNYTTAEKNKLSGIAAGAEVNVQANWAQTTTTADDYIKNKPTLATVATSGSYNDLSNKPTIPAAQVQSDWAQTTTTAVDYIKNRPTLATVATTGSYNDLSNKPTIPTVNNATLTVQKEGSSIGTFTANSATNATINVVETDPTVPSWAKQSTKPAYSYSEITNKPTLAAVATSGSYNDLSDKPTPIVLNMTYDTAATTWTATDAGITLYDTPNGTSPAFLEQIQTFAVPTPVFTNASTGSTLDAEGLYNLLETGADVILNGVPIGVGRTVINSSSTFAVGSAVCDGVKLTKAGPLHAERTDSGTGDVVFSVDMTTYSTTVPFNALNTMGTMLLPFAIRVYKRVTLNVDVDPNPQTEYAFEVQGTLHQRMDSPT